MAGFHSTRRNESLPLVPFFAAILKVRLSRTGTFAGVNLVPTDFHFHRARSNREQNCTITRAFASPQESQVEKMAPEGLTGDGGEAARDFTEN